MEHKKDTKYTEVSFHKCCLFIVTQRNLGLRLGLLVPALGFRTQLLNAFPGGLVTLGAFPLQREESPLNQLVS